MLMYVGDLEFEHWKDINMYFGAYKYLSEKLLEHINQRNIYAWASKLTELEQNVIEPIDVLPYDYTLIMLEYS